MEKIRKNGILSGVFFAVFLLLILLIRLVDVQPIGPMDTEIGFAALNGLVHEATGVHPFFEKLTDLMGLGSMAVGFLLCCGAPIQFLKYRSLKKVNKVLLLLIAFYLLLGVVYVFFEIVVVNLRPVLEAGALEPEASFPSSHTVLCCSVLGSFLVVLRLSGETGKLSTTVRVILWVLIAVAVVGRLVSGVHWFTDILGGVLLSFALVFGLKAVLCGVKGRKN